MITYEIYAKFRNSQNLKDSDVSRMANIPQSTFSDWKKGKSSPKTEKLEKIRKALGLSMSEFFGDSDMDPMDIVDMLPESKRKQLMNIGVLPNETDFLSHEALDVAKQFDELDEESKRQLVLMLAFFKSQKQD